MVAAPRVRSISSVSRGAQGIEIREDPLLDPRAYALRVAEVCRLFSVSLLIPTTDGSLEAVLEHRTLVPDSTVLPFPSLEVYRAASDKVLVHQLACAVGIGVDETVIVSEPGMPAPEDLSLYPGVVKPHRSVVGSTARFKSRVELVADRSECATVLRGLPREAFPVMVQRRVRGPGEGYFVARWRGETIARFAHRRLREKPPSGGVSVYRESIHVTPEIQRACDAMLDSLNWEGVAMIEGKLDLDRGGWRVMEINGRFWGSLQLAIDAGVDFPARLARATLGSSDEHAGQWRAGARLRWEWGDIDHLMLRILRSRRQLDLPPEAPGRLGAIINFLRHRPGRDHLEMLRWDDPAPFALESLRRLGIPL